MYFSGHSPQFYIKDDNGPEMDVNILSTSPFFQHGSTFFNIFQLFFCISGHLPQFNIKDNNGPKMDVYILSASPVRAQDR